MLVMHLFLLHHRLKDEDQSRRRISQLVFDAFIDDMDSALREAAVGDQTVPKRIAKMTQVFYGRTGVFEQAIAADNPIQALAVVIDRNLFPDGSRMSNSNSLAEYFFTQYQDLAKTPANSIAEKAQIFVNPLPDSELKND